MTDPGYIGEVVDPVPNSAYTVTGVCGGTANVDDLPDEDLADEVYAAWEPLLDL